MGLFCMGDNTMKMLWQKVCITFLPNASKVFIWFQWNLHHRCTLWWRPHNQSCGSRRQIIIFQFFSSLVSISPLKNLQSGPQTWRNNTKKSKLRQNALLGQTLNSLRSHFHEYNVLLGFLRFRKFASFRGFQLFWYTLYNNEMVPIFRRGRSRFS